MGNKKLLTSIGSICLILVLAALPFMAACPAPAPPEDGDLTPAPPPKPEVKTLKAVAFLPVDFIAMAHMHKYADAVKEYSDGQLIIDILGDGEVIPTEEQIFAVGAGTIDMIFSMGDDISQGSPVGFAMALTNMSTKEERERGLWDYYREILARDCNVYYLGQLMSPQWWILTSNIPAKSPDELKGLKIRCGATHFGSVEAIGAVPVSTPMMDIYPAMERGIIDAFVFPPQGWTQFGWQDVTRYWVGPRIVRMQNSCPLINLDAWNSLTKEQQTWLTQPIIDYEEDLYAYQWWVITGEEYGEASILKAGLERIEWSDEDNKWFQDSWREALWDYVEEQMAPADFARFEELVGH